MIVTFLTSRCLALSTTFLISFTTLSTSSVGPFITTMSSDGTLTSLLPSALAERSAAPVRDDPNLTETGASLPPVMLLSVLPFGPIIYR
jgi:hypothetical protein